ncbi:N-acetyltransferase family protein [Paenibacillus sp. 2TAF8]|uniref:GNAT family N-acetyltransferase n=1 Tax=Paenibacillus sp. 2TAF8 TaxID=3233020 RepID=UPI003F97FEC9
MSECFNKHQGRYSVLVAEENDQVVGWASINSYSPRSVYDMSVTSPFIFIVIIVARGLE